MADFTMLEPGEMLGAVYAIDSLMGGGSSGLVYSAKNDTEHIFAVKLCKFDLSELEPEEREEAVRRLEREFNVLQALGPHPYIVPVYGFGWHEGVPYFVMELVEGRPLAKALKEQRPLRLVLETFRKVVEAVAYMHERGVCHRDLTPSNIIIREDGTPVLIDFGIAKAPHSGTLTNAMQMLGTLEYMSPECASHDYSGESGRYVHKPVDDVYALGVILYQMLAGGLPFGPRAVRKLVGNGGVPKHPCEVAPRTPRAIGDFAMKLLTKAAERPKDGREVLGALEALLESESRYLFAAGPEPATEPFLRSRKAKPAWWASARGAWTRGWRKVVASTGGLLLLGIGLSLVFGHAPDRGGALLAEAAHRKEAPPSSPWLPLMAERLSCILPQDSMSPFGASGLPWRDFAAAGLLLLPKGSESLNVKGLAKRAVAVATACVGLHCAGVQKRTDDLVWMERCSAEAKAGNEQLKRLGWDVDDAYNFQLDLNLRIELGTPVFIPEGSISAVWETTENERNLVLDGARFFGKAKKHGDAFMSVRFDQVRLKDGRTFPICAIAYDYAELDVNKPGLTKWNGKGAVRPNPLEGIRPDEMPYRIDSVWIRLR